MIQQNKIEDIKSRFFEPIDISILVFFRIAFGAIMLWEVIRYFDHGWIERYWITPTFHFSYYGFDWVKPWPGELMFVHFYALGILAIFIMCGFMYRISAILFFLGFTYMFLLDQTQYLNHFYLISLISFLIIFIPAHKAFSIDSQLRGKNSVAPMWTLFLLRAQLAIVYFFGGIAKLNADWLIRGEPLKEWLFYRTDFPIIGQYFTHEWAGHVFAYSAFFIDLLIVPFLIWKKTRIIAFGFAVAFHILNAFLFSIGIFPWFMIVATALFFPPSWFRRLFKIKNKWNPQTVFTKSKKQRKLILVLIMIYFIVQIGLPLRHYMYPNNVSWTEDGHNFAWHMKLRNKDTHFLEFTIINPTSGASWKVDPQDELTARQAGKMASRPDMIIQYAHHLADKFERYGFEDVEVNVKVIASLNGRDQQDLIDPTADLDSYERTLLPKPWIVPLNQTTIDEFFSYPK